MEAGPQIGLKLHLLGSICYFILCSKQLRERKDHYNLHFIDGETECRDINGLAKPTY